MIKKGDDQVRWKAIALGVIMLAVTVVQALWSRIEYVEDHLS